MSDILVDALEHSWGKSPKQKAREKEYNAQYYKDHKEKWLDNKKQSGLFPDPSNLPKKKYAQLPNMDMFGNITEKPVDPLYKPHITNEALRQYRSKLRSKLRGHAYAENEKQKLALSTKRNQLISEIVAEQQKQNKSVGKKIREFIDGTVEVAMDTAKKNIDAGIQFLSDFFGISSKNQSRTSRSESTNSSTRPRSRQKNVTQNGTGVNRRGDGLGTGPTGKWR